MLNIVLLNCNCISDLFDDCILSKDALYKIVFLYVFLHECRYIVFLPGWWQALAGMTVSVSTQCTQQGDNLSLTGAVLLRQEPSTDIMFYRAEITIVLQ